ncbi:MAG: hypothetical protein WBX15_15350 [Thermoanaerobaculia bacterium]
MRFRALLLLLALALVAQTGSAQIELGGDGAVSRTWVPVIGTVPGPGGIQWRTDVTVANYTGRDTIVVLTMVAAPEQPVTFISMQPGQVITYTNIATETFGSPGRLSPLEIRNTGNIPVSVRATAYPVDANGPGTAEDLAIVYDEPMQVPQRVSGLLIDETHRTNIGVANLGEEEAVVSLILQRVEGRVLAETTFRLGPQSLIQAPLQFFFPLVSEGSGFSVAAVASNPACSFYGSVIRNGSNDAVFVGPSPASTFP